VGEARAEKKKEKNRKGRKCYEILLKYYFIFLGYYIY
jgi:hypothetical protein